MEAKVSTTEIALEDSQEELTNSRLRSTGLVRIVKELKGKISQDEAQLPKQKKAWAPARL